MADIKNTTLIKSGPGQSETTVATHKTTGEATLLLKPNGTPAVTLQAGAVVQVLDEYIGPNSEWHRVKVADPNYPDFLYENYHRTLYARTSNLTFIDSNMQSLPRQYFCKKYKSYMAPNWKSISELEPFLDLTTCEYCIVAVPRNENGVSYKDTVEFNEDPAKMYEKALDAGIRGLLLYYDKSRSEKRIQELKSAFKFAYIPPGPQGWYLDDRPYAPLKFLVKVPAKYFDAIPRKVETFEDFISSQGPWWEESWLTTRLITETFEEKIAMVTRQFLKYQENIDIAPMDVIGLNFERESERLEVFVREIRKLVELNGFRWRPSCDNVLEIAVANDYRQVVYVSYSDGLSASVPLKIGFNRFKNIEPMDCARTLAYIHRLEAMVSYFRNNAAPPWSDFVGQYVYPPVAIDPGSGIMAPEKFVDKNLPTKDWKKGACKTLSMAEGIAKKIQGRKSGPKSRPLPPKKQKEQDDFFTSDMFLGVKEACNRNAVDQIGDALLSNIGPILRSGFDGNAIDKLWTDILNKVTIYDLFMFILSCISSQMTLDEFLQAFCKAIMDILPTDDLMRVYKCLEPTVKAEVAAFNAASKGEKFSDGWNDLFEKTLDNFSDAVKFSLEEQARKKSNENEYAKATPGSATTEDRLVQSLLNNPIDKEACAVGSIYDKSRIPITVTVDDGEGNQIDFESDDETMRTAFDNIVGPEELWRCMQSALTAEKLQNACWQLIEHLMDAYETGQKAVKLLTSLPKIPKINGLSILKFIGEQIREMIIALVTQVIIMIVQEVLESIKEACKPKREVEEFYGGADVKQFIPPGAAEKAFGDLKLPPNIFDDLSELMDDLSVMMLPSELCTLLNGDPSPDTKKIVRDLLEEKYPNLELKCGVNIEDLLDRIGLYVPVEMCDEISQNAFEPPSLFGLLCETDAPMVHFRHKLLSGKMNAEEVKQQLNQRKREQQEKLRKYTDMMAKGNPLEDLLPEILSSCGLDGSTAGTGIIPRDIPSVSYSVDKVTSSQFSMVEAIFNKDMLAFPKKIINESFIEPDKGSVSNPEDPIFEVAARIAETTRSDWDEADENGKLQILKEVMAANGMVKMSQGVLPGYKNIVADPARVNKYLGSMLQDNQGTIDTDYLDHTARYKFSVPAIKAFDLTPPKALQKLQKKVAYYRGLITEFKASKLDIETIPPKERTKQQKRALKNIKEGLGDVKDNFKETKQKAEEHLAAYKEQRANPANFKETVPAAKPHYPIDWEIISKAKADVEPFAEFALRITDLNDDLVLEHTISEPFKNIDATENFDFTEDGSTFQAASFANLLYNSFASGPAGAKNPKKFQLKEVGSLDSPLEDVFANLPMPPEVEEELTLPVHPFKTPIVTEYFKKYVFHSAYSGRMKFALKEMAQSPLLDARTLQSIRLTPSAEDTSCPPSQTGNKVGILNVESLKNSARDIFDKSCHSMLDMGEALDKANSIAFVYLTIRVFALEELMKSIFVFTQLNMKDIMEDNIIAEYFSLIIGDKIAKSNLTAPSGMGYKSKSNNNIDNPSTFSQEELLVDIMKERKKVQETIEDPYTGEILYQKKTVEQTLYHAMNIDQLSDTTSIIKFLVKEQIKDLAVGIDSAFDQAIKTHRKNPYESLIDFVVDVPLNAYSPRLWRSPVPVPVGDGNEETLYNTVFPGSLKLAYEGGFLVERFIRVTDHSEDFLKGALADDVLLTDMYAEAVLYRNGGPGNPYGCKGIDCVREDGLAVNTDIESESNDIYSGIGEEFEIPAHLGGVVNIDAFGKWLSINEYLLGGNIGKQASQYFSNVEYGIRLVYLPALMPEIDPPTWQQAHAQTRFMQYLKGWPGPGANDEMWDLNAVPFDISFGPNNEFEIPNPEVVAFEKAYALMEDVNLLKSDTPPSVPIAPWVHTIPLIEYAMPIEISTAGGNKAFKDMTIGELRLAMDSIIKSEIEDDPLSSIGPVNFNVLLQELINTPEYRLLVEDIFSVGKHSSLSMIYSTTLVSKLAPEVENCFAATKDASRLLLHAMQTEGNREKFYNHTDTMLEKSLGSSDQSEVQNKMHEKRCFTGPDFDNMPGMVDFDAWNALDLDQLFKKLAVKIDPNFKALAAMFQAGEICEVNWSTLFQLWPVNFPLGWGPPLTPIGMIGLSLGLLPCEDNACKDKKCDEELAKTTHMELFNEVTITVDTDDISDLTYVPEAYSTVIDQYLVLQNRIIEDTGFFDTAAEFQQWTANQGGGVGQPLPESYLPMDTYPGPAGGEPIDRPEKIWAMAKKQLVEALYYARGGKIITWNLGLDTTFNNIGTVATGKAPIDVFTALDAVGNTAGNEVTEMESNIPKKGTQMTGPEAAYYFITLVKSERKSLSRDNYSEGEAFTAVFHLEGVTVTAGDHNVGNTLTEGDISGMSAQDLSWYDAWMVDDTDEQELFKAVSTGTRTISEPSAQDRIAMLFCDAWCKYGSILPSFSQPLEIIGDVTPTGNETVVGFGGVDSDAPESWVDEGVPLTFEDHQSQRQTNAIIKFMTECFHFSYGENPEFENQAGVSSAIVPHTKDGTDWQLTYYHPEYTFGVGSEIDEKLGFVDNVDAPAPSVYAAFQTFAAKCAAYSAPHPGEEFIQGGNKQYCANGCGPLWNSVMKESAWMANQENTNGLIAATTVAFECGPRTRIRRIEKTVTGKKTVLEAVDVTMEDPVTGELTTVKKFKTKEVDVSIEVPSPYFVCEAQPIQYISGKFKADSDWKVWAQNPHKGVAYHKGGTSNSTYLQDAIKGAEAAGCEFYPSGLHTKSPPWVPIDYFVGNKKNMVPGNYLATTGDPTFMGPDMKTVSNNLGPETAVAWGAGLEVEYQGLASNDQAFINFKNQLLEQGIEEGSDEWNSAIASSGHNEIDSSTGTTKAFSGGLVGHSQAVWNKVVQYKQDMQGELDYLKVKYNYVYGSWMLAEEDGWWAGQSYGGAGNIPFYNPKTGMVNFPQGHNYWSYDQDIDLFLESSFWEGGEFTFPELTYKNTITWEDQEKGYATSVVGLWEVADPNADPSGQASIYTYGHTQKVTAFGGLTSGGTNMAKDQSGVDSNYDIIKAQSKGDADFATFSEEG